ncbi:MAG: putative DNA-binding domain-containing protein [Deltaproteobacteria bacterium]|nr:putative DNA-binding domain-containing protein [Deltaproteobacteria bacterium]
MSKLAQAQIALADVLRLSTSLTEDPYGGAIAAEIAAGNERLSPVEQVDIYREQFFLRHVDALREDFRSLEHLLGDDDFEALARAYLAAFPPTSYTLRDLGASMERFVRTQEPWSKDPFVADLARTEWAFVEAFDGPDSPAFDPSVLASATEDQWPGARIVFQNAMRRIALEHPAHDYRLAVKKEEAPARPEPAPTWVVVYRGKENLQFIDVERDAFELLEELARGTALGEACERAAKASNVDPASFETKLGQWFQEWTAFGWISRVLF